MKVTYISHSGFALELPSASLLFDYYKGQLPAFPTDKPLFIFSSHSHGDHFVPEVFDLANKHPHVHYIFSHDIWLMRKKHTRAGVPEEYFESATYMRAHETQQVSLSCTNASPTDTFLTVTTLRSTDMGVAFLVECDGLRIYHAGDLHWWAWPGDTKQNINNMTANYQREIAHLRELLATQSDISSVTTDTSSDLADISSILSSLDLAFLPLDGRLEENYALGIEYFLEKIPTRHVFPMHFWDNYEVVSDYLETYDPPKDGSLSSPEDSSLMIHPIAHENEVWNL